MFLLDIDHQEIEHNIRALLTSFFPGCIIGYESSGEVEFKVICKDGNLYVDDSYLGRCDNAQDAARYLYNHLVDRTGRKLPWGMLTGVRPSKIPYGMILEGKSEKECEDFLVNCRGVSRTKSKLATDVALREYKLLSQRDFSDGYSLYIGIPFCPTRCLYCSFSAFPLKKYEKMVDIYLDALIKELSAVKEIAKDRRLDTIYIGGGTPTTLNPMQLDRLLGFIESEFDLTDLLEFSLEAGRPDSITSDKLEAIKRHRVDRISINPQTMNDETLKLIGRCHYSEDIIKAYELSKELGFDNINMDLIVGLPGEDLEDIKKTLEKVIELDPENITIHSLSIKRASRLNLLKENYEEKKFLGIDEAIDYTYDRLTNSDYSPYYMYRQRNQAGNFENVGYSKTGKACLYNILIMEEIQPIIACGAGAASKMVYGMPPHNRIERIENVKDVEGYIRRIDEMIERKKEGLWMS